VVTAAAAAAREALARTREQLDVLAASGVVDAGAAGLCVLLDSLAATVTGGARARAVEGPAPAPRAAWTSPPGRTQGGFGGGAPRGQRRGARVLRLRGHLPARGAGRTRGRAQGAARCAGRLAGRRRRRGPVERARARGRRGGGDRGGTARRAPPQDHRDLARPCGWRHWGQRRARGRGGGRGRRAFGGPGPPRGAAPP